MVIQKLFLKGSVEPLDMGIHLGCFRIGMPMGLTEPSQLFIEVLHKLGTIVCEDKGERVGKDLANDLEEFFSG